MTKYAKKLVLGGFALADACSEYPVTINQEKPKVQATIRISQRTRTKLGRFDLR